MHKKKRYLILTNQTSLTCIIFREVKHQVPMLSVSCFIKSYNVMLSKYSFVIE